MTSVGTLLDPAKLLAEGASRAGRAVPSDASWVPAFELLVTSAVTEGGLTESAAVVLGEKVTTLMDERLRAEDLFAQHEVSSRPLPVHFAIAGLARSGTTFLHRLLTCDPDVTFLPTWQAFHPVPPRTGPDDRRARTVATIREIAEANPEALKIHPLDADAPEEEVFLLQHSFASMLFAIPCPLPSYNAWLNAADHTDAYQFAFDLLRLNDAASGASPRPRIMKSPQFLLDLGGVDRLLPDAVIVQTHRDPVDLVGSYCSVYANSRARSTVALDPVALGQERLAQLQTMAERSIAVRDAARGSNRFVDVRYHELVAAPLEVVECLYERAGLRLGAVTRRAMEEWLSANPQGKAGRHSYDLADYGLDRDAIEARLGRYLDRFDVRREP